MDAGQRVIPPRPSTLSRDVLPEPRHCSVASEVLLRGAGQLREMYVYVCVRACVPGAVISAQAALEARHGHRGWRGVVVVDGDPRGLKSRLSQTFDLPTPPQAVTHTRTLLHALACKIWCAVPLPAEADVSGIRRRRPPCYSSHVYRLQKRIKKKTVFFPPPRMATDENSESVPASLHLLNKPSQPRITRVHVCRNTTEQSPSAHGCL